MRTGAMVMAICALLLSAVDCAPAAEPRTAALQIRDDAASWLDAWSLPSFEGFHKRYTAPHGQCIDIRADFPPGTPDGLSSVQNGPIPSSECTLFATPDCTIRPGQDNDWGDRLYSGGIYEDLDDPEIGWGNKAQSFMCYSV